MAKYLKKFETHREYETYIGGQDVILPNVSYCEDQNEVHYNPWVDPKLVCKYNVTSTSSPTQLRTNYEQNIFKSMEIDGVQLDNLVTEYTFDSTGVHTVKYELYDETKLGNNAPVFLSITSLISVSIPNSVTSIGRVAFNGCRSLTSITIPNSVTSIGGGAFQSCTNLTSITIPNSVTTIGEEAFNSCSGLTNVTIPNSVTSIGSGVFTFCSGLASVTIGNGVTSIGERTFKKCSSLTSINIPSGVTSIGSYAFEDCSGLTSVTTLAATPPTLNSSPFYNTNNCPIYVPSASVDAYKAAWTEYASRIQAIP